MEIPQQFKSAFCLLVIVLLSSIVHAQDNYMKEYKKIGKLFDAERYQVKKESCKDCSYISLIRVYLGKDRQLDSIQMSHSTPLSLLGLPEKLKALDVKWSKFVENDPAKKVIVIPLMYFNETKGKVIFGSASDLRMGLYEFSSGSLFAGDLNSYYWLQPYAIWTATGPTDSSFGPGPKM